MKDKHILKRVVITGFGALTAAGNTVDATWESISTGKTGITTIQDWDVDGWEHPLGAELKDFQPSKMIADRKLLKLISRQDVIGLNAVQQALDHSGLLAYRESLTDATKFNDRTGVFVGSPGNRFQQQYDFLPLFTRAQGDLQKFADGLFEEIHPMWLLRILPNNVLAYVGIQHGFKGPNENITNHAVSGIQAIAEACRSLKYGYSDRAVVVSYEAGVEPEGQIYYGSLGALSARALKPFDKQHDGTILGEGAGAIILETLESAKARGAKIYGEIIGDATTSEAQGVFNVRDDADGLVRALHHGLDTASLKASDIGLVVTHGNGNPTSDNTEALAISQVFGKEGVPATSFKWSLGHTLSAAGTLETIFGLCALNAGQLPGIANLTEKAAECAHLNVTCDFQAVKTPHALIIARGFASNNSCLIIRNEITE